MDRKRRKSLTDIIETMIRYRDKPKDEPLSKAEGLLCMCAYFDNMNLERKRYG